MEAWRKALERAQRSFELIDAVKLAAAFCRSPSREVPETELMLASDCALEREGFTVRCDLSADAPANPWPAATTVSGRLLLQTYCDVADDRSVAAFRLAAATCSRILAGVPADQLEKLGIDHHTDSEAGVDRWVAMLFAAAWWGNVVGSPVACEMQRAIDLVPRPDLLPYELAAEDFRQPARVWWMSDLVAISVSLIDLLLASPGDEVELQPRVALDRRGMRMAEAEPLIRDYLAKHASLNRPVRVAELVYCVTRN